MSSALVAAGLFPILSCLVSLICSLLTEAFYYPWSLPFSRLSRAEPNFSRGRWRPRGHALSMARQSSVGSACGWLVSAVFWAWIEKKALLSLTVFVFETKKWNARAHSVRANLQRFQSLRSYRAQTRKSSSRTVLNPQLWPWGEQLQQRAADQFVPLLKVSRLVTADRQTSYRAHALSSVAKSLLTQINMGSTKTVQLWVAYEDVKFTHRNIIAVSFVTLSFTAPKSGHFLLFYTALFCFWFPKGQCTTSEVSSTPTWLWLLALLSCFSCSVWTWPRTRLVILLLCKSLEITAKTVLCRRLERLTCQICSQETLSPWLTHDYRAHVSANEQNCCVLKGGLQCPSVFCGTILHSLPTFNRPPPDFKGLTGLYLPAHSWSF